MTSDYKLVEQCRNPGIFHLAHPDVFPLMSLCGKQTIMPPDGVEWGKVVEGKSNKMFCSVCEKLANRD